jgi:hypothetical protein
VGYLMKMRGMSYKDSCALLGQEPTIRTSSRTAPTRQAFEPRPATSPSALWQEKGRALVDWAERNLWSDAGVEARAYLQGRGLTPATIRAAHLGLVLEDLWREREAWGLEPAHYEDGPRQGQPKKLWLPAGLVVPTFTAAGQLARVKVRRWEGEPRYYALPGSSAAPLVAGQGDAVVVVESELDALLLAQETGDLVQAMALGSAQNRPDAEAWAKLQAAHGVLVALDADAAGVKEAWGWWRENLPRALRWPPLRPAKDPTEMLLAGVDPKVWVEVGLEEIVSQSRPPEMPQHGRSPAGQGVGRPHEQVVLEAAQSLDAAVVDVGGDNQVGLMHHQAAPVAEEELAVHQAEPLDHEDAGLVRCGECILFRPSSGDAIHGLGLCQGQPHDGHRGQWPNKVHMCGGFTTREAPQGGPHPFPCALMKEGEA